ncbi:MAG: hypothetical protein QG646_1955 [Euryarchaeota archaeon]|nr:hypothetical protein [Euryarchaeota archaeon]
MNKYFGFIVFLMLLLLILGYFLSINKLTLIALGISFFLSIITRVLSARAEKKNKNKD